MRMPPNQATAFRLGLSPQKIHDIFKINIQTSNSKPMTCHISKPIQALLFTQMLGSSGPSHSPSLTPSSHPDYSCSNLDRHHYLPPASNPAPLQPILSRAVFRRPAFDPATLKFVRSLPAPVLQSKVLSKGNKVIEMRPPLTSPISLKTTPPLHLIEPIYFSTYSLAGGPMHETPPCFTLWLTTFCLSFAIQHRQHFTQETSADTWFSTLTKRTSHPFSVPLCFPLAVVTLCCHYWMIVLSTLRSLGKVLCLLSSCLYGSGIGRCLALGIFID